MIIPPLPAISRLAQRFHERRARAAMGERPPLTTDDEENIVSFSVIVKELIQLLEDENAALRHSDLMQVIDLFPHKETLLKRLENSQPVIEPFIRDDTEITRMLRDHLRALAEQIQTNAVLLSAMAEASRSIRLEMVRVRERHSLKGMYGNKGQVIDAAVGTQKRIDTNF